MYINSLSHEFEWQVHATIYHLLQSHGWLDELAIFAEMRKDFTTAPLLYQVLRKGAAGNQTNSNDVC